MVIEDGLAAIVTGGASGLGYATAQALIAKGVNVSVFDNNKDEGAAKAAEIGANFQMVDIREEQSVLDGFASARAINGQERILIHCAQVSKFGQTIQCNALNGSLTRLPTEDFEFSSQGVLVASYRVASIAALGMAHTKPINRDGERGCVVLTSSVAAQDAQIGQVCYGACKAGVDGLVLPMARDLMQLGIRVNSIMPGIFSTPPMLDVKSNSPEVFDNLLSSVVFPQRLGRPEEYASLVLEIVGNTYLNGHSFRLDGGIRMPIN